MDFEKLIAVRQSCRSFQPRAVAREDIVACLEAARLAPSACNAQPMHYTVCTGDMAARVGACTRSMGMNAFTAQVPCFVVVSEGAYSFSAAVGSRAKGQDYRSVDIGIAAAHFVLCAAERGLATLSPLDVRRKGSTTAILCGHKLDSHAMEGRLRERGIIASGRGDVIRIAPHFYSKPQEIDAALEMEVFMKSHGAGKLAFDTIFVSGAKTSLPHGVPGDKRIEAGDFVTMDFGANVDGYCTDMTRTVAVGHVSDEQKKVYDTVLKAQLACCGFAKAGYKGCEVDKVARDIIYGAGYEGCFGHGLGHAVGIEIHENPRYSPTCSDIIQSGMVMTIEPGIYLPGKFGVRIEDTTFVRPDGCEIVGKSPKELIVL